jgi:hypothetical protein
MMMNLNILNLDLRAPLRYRREAGLLPFGYDPSRGEALFVFALSPAQCRSFEPSPEALVGPLLAQGLSAGDAAAAGGLVLPAGKYLFAQTREPLNPGAFIEMAVEVQKEGLWQGLKPEPRLYLRYLLEEDSPVSQLFRPLLEVPSYGFAKPAGLPG